MRSPKRVGELHQQIAATPAPGDPGAIRLRDEAVARNAALENALASVQDELASMREAHGEIGARGAGHARGCRQAAQDLGAGARGAGSWSSRRCARRRTSRETQAGMLVAEKLRRRDLYDRGSAARDREALAGASDRARSEAPAARRAGHDADQPRGEGRERSSRQVSIRARRAPSETSRARRRRRRRPRRPRRSSRSARRRPRRSKAMRNADAASARERLEELEKTIVPGMARAADALANEAKAQKLTSRSWPSSPTQFETRRDRLVELGETSLAAAETAAKAAEAGRRRRPRAPRSRRPRRSSPMPRSARPS